MTDEYENGPLKNTSAMKCIAVLIVSPTSQTKDLTELFGQANKDHDYLIMADGTKSYVALGTVAGTIDEAATGNGATVCWPIPDGTCLPFKPTGGRETATGIATYVHYNVLHYKVAAGAATGYLRIYRGSLGRGQGSEEFKAP